MCVLFFGLIINLTNQREGSVKLTPDQIEYIAKQDWKEAMPFSTVTEPMLIDGVDTGYKKVTIILETKRGDRLEIRK